MGASVGRHQGGSTWDRVWVAWVMSHSFPIFKCNSDSNAHNVPVIIRTPDNLAILVGTAPPLVHLENPCLAAAACTGPRGSVAAAN